ncbi:hypothetical protein IJJ08_01910, partial [bacterium]|nr:hypothetical protein [bacterium]
VIGSTANGTYDKTFWHRGMAFNGAYGDACYEDGRLPGQGSDANYWSSTAQSATNAYDLLFNTSGNVNPVNYGNKYDGRTVRCIAKM